MLPRRALEPEDSRERPPDPCDQPVVQCRRYRLPGKCVSCGSCFPLSRVLVPNTDNLQATKSHYEFGINRAGGALYGFFLDSPVYAAAFLWHNNRKPADPAKLPKLRAFSDILWGYWSRDNPDVKLSLIHI